METKRVKKGVLDWAADKTARILIAIRHRLLDKDLPTWAIDQVLDIIEVWESRHIWRRHRETMAAIDALEDEFLTELADQENIH